MKTTFIAAAFALSGFAALTPSLANDFPEARVPYSDLNLASPAGAQAMLNRIKAAASRVCGGTPDNREIAQKQFYRGCVKVATDRAVAQLNAPMVTALHTGRKPTDPRFAGR